MSEKNSKTTKTPKNKPRAHGLNGSVLVLSEREQALLDVVRDNGFSLGEVLKVALSMEETRGGAGFKLDLSSMRGHSRKTQVNPESIFESDSETESKVQPESASARSRVVPGRGQTKRTRIKEARKELILALVPEIDLILQSDDLKTCLERLAWLQNSVDWDFMSQNSEKLKGIPSPKVELIKKVLSSINLQALLKEKAEAVKASAPPQRA